ncbi:MAG: hypothetical protein ACRC8S_14155 [Fimbriiglobus sp.]
MAKPSSPTTKIPKVPPFLSGRRGCLVRHTFDVLSHYAWDMYKEREPQQLKSILNNLSNLIADLHFVMQILNANSHAINQKAQDWLQTLCRELLEELTNSIVSLNSEASEAQCTKTRNTILGYVVELLEDKFIEGALGDLLSQESLVDTVPYSALEEPKENTIPAEFVSRKKEDYGD